MATIRIRQAGNLLPLKSLKTKHLGVVRTLRSLKVMADGVLRTVASFVPALSAVCSPSALSFTGRSQGGLFLGVGPTTCIVSGGIAPFRYAWLKISGDDFVVTNQGQATTLFTRALVGPGVSFAATYRCIVTDAAGQTASADVSVFVQNLGGNP